MTKTDIARKVTQEFIDAALNNNTSYSKNKIAAYIYDLHPDKFRDKEDARKYVRLVTGSMGGGKNSITGQAAWAGVQLPI